MLQNTRYKDKEKLNNHKSSNNNKQNKQILREKLLERNQTLPTVIDMLNGNSFKTF